MLNQKTHPLHPPCLPLVRSQGPNQKICRRAPSWDPQILFVGIFVYAMLIPQMPLGQLTDWFLYTRGKAFEEFVYPRFIALWDGRMEAVEQVEFGWDLIANSSRNALAIEFIAYPYPWI